MEVRYEKLDLSDYTALRANFDPGEEYEKDALVAGSVAAFAATAALGPGEVQLRINADGSAELVGEGALIDGFQIVGTDETILEDNCLDLEDLIELTGDAYVAALTPSPTDPGVTIDGSLALGAIYNNLGFDGTDLSFSYSTMGQTIDGLVQFVPEPAAGMLLTLGLLGGVGCRRLRSR